MPTRLGLGLGIGSGGFVSTIYQPKKDRQLDVFLSSRNGNTLTDTSGNSLNAKILPAVFRGNSSGYYPYSTTALYASDDWVAYWTFEFVSIPSANNIGLCGQGAGLIFMVGSDNKWYLDLSDGTNNRNIVITTTTLPFQVRKYTLIVVHQITGFTTIYENGV